MSNWNHERKCIDCGTITKKRRHISCPACGGILKPHSEIPNEELSSLTREQTAVFISDFYY